MAIRVEILPFLGFAFLVCLLVVLLCGQFSRKGWRRASVPGLVLFLAAAGYLAWFFRDPERMAPADPDSIVAAADGVVAGIVNVREDKYLHADTVRISIFLSLVDVHVNRAPMAGRSTFLGYFPGKRLFTFQEKSSEVNQHNAILMANDRTRCLIKQIVGPVARRVVYWPDPTRPVDLAKGERIGMMKFGSRLDMYFPASDITVLAKKGDRVRAGETVIATLRTEGNP